MNQFYIELCVWSDNPVKPIRNPAQSTRGQNLLASNTTTSLISPAAPRVPTSLMHQSAAVSDSDPYQIESHSTRKAKRQRQRIKRSTVSMTTEWSRLLISISLQILPGQILTLSVLSTVKAKKDKICTPEPKVPPNGLVPGPTDQSLLFRVLVLWSVLKLSQSRTNVAV